MISCGMHQWNGLFDYRIMRDVTLSCEVLLQYIPFSHKHTQLTPHISTSLTSYGVFFSDFKLLFWNFLKDSTVQQININLAHKCLILAYLIILSEYHSAMKWRCNSVPFLQTFIFLLPPCTCIISEMYKKDIKCQRKGCKHVHVFKCIKS